MGIEDQSPFVIVFVTAVGMVIGGLFFGVIGSGIGAVLALLTYSFTVEQLENAQESTTIEESGEGE